MAGMHGLGRLFNIVGTASGVGIALEACSAITFYGTNDGTYTLTAATSFGGSYTQPSGWNPITLKWTNADNGVGTGTWTKVTQSASNAVVTATDIAVVFTLFGSQVPATYNYVMCTKTSANDGNPSCLAIVHDLTVQRAPAALTALSA
jgi:hypothetical protein